MSAPMRTADTAGQQLLTSIDPTTGEQFGEGVRATSTADVTAIVDRAAAAAPVLQSRGRAFRATLLKRIADELESRRDEIVALGAAETGLAEARLNGELTRTAYQARFFAEVLEEGSLFEASIDRAEETPMGPCPDLRRILVSVGPVSVFGASNFPLAFSVAGGDTVSALAAGSPVVVKAHSSHPRLSALVHEALAAAVEVVGAPTGTVGIVYGTGAGADLVAHPLIRAVGFTGSLSGAQALMEIIERRDEPIPFYGELSSINPLVVSRSAVEARGREIATGLAAAITGSGGQLCTKPGLVLVPSGSVGDRFVELLGEELGAAPAAVLLNSRIHASYAEITDGLDAHPDVRNISRGGNVPDQGFHVSPRVFEVEADALTPDVLAECFGPAALVVRYSDQASLRRAFSKVPSSLTATLHVEPGEEDLAIELAELVQPKSGRIVFDQYPTGVIVSWAQHHGGPWPSTNTLHTSVGATAIRRFLRPVVWQNAPQAVLPEELRDGEVDIVRRVDGKLQLPGAPMGR